MVSHDGWLYQAATAPTRLYPTGPTLQTLLQHSPRASSSPSPPAPPRFLSTGCCSSPGCSCRRIHGLSLLQPSSTAAQGLLRGCTWRCALCSAHGLQGDMGHSWVLLTEPPLQPLLTKPCHISPLKISLKSHPHCYLEKLPGKL